MKTPIELKIILALNQIMKGDDKRVTQYKLSQLSGVHTSTLSKYFKKFN